ncbi:Os02g0811700 [Oryza sativa Japonica Group]|uniref:Os02g0811700 protein n=1 Tax=Oryza sativa subsp. japonica TaxID=39947 RepID=A0A0P0VRE6_ORYSJ|nr:Os02g0811700 [Oryza sativa Japonica Group]
MPLHDLHSRLSPRPRPFRLSLSSGSPQAPSRDQLRAGHGVTSASASLRVRARLHRLRGHARLCQRRGAPAVVVVRLGVEPRLRHLSDHAQLLCCQRCDLARLAVTAATCDSAGRARLRRLPTQARHGKPLHATRRPDRRSYSLASAR